VPNQIGREDRGVALRSVREGRGLQRIVEGDFRTDRDGRREPMLPAHRVVEVRGLEARALSRDVVEIFRAPGDVVLRRELPVEVAEQRPFARRAGRVQAARALRRIRAVHQVEEHIGRRAVEGRRGVWLTFYSPNLQVIDQAT
jgi:hypothetical protein